MKGLAGLFAALIALVDEITCALKDWREVRREQAKLNLRLLKGLNKVADAVGPGLEIVVDEIGRELSKPEALEALRKSLRDGIAQVNKRRAVKAKPLSKKSIMLFLYPECPTGNLIACLRNHREETDCSLLEARTALDDFLRDCEEKGCRVLYDIRKMYPLKDNEGCGHAASDHTVHTGGTDCSKDHKIEGEEE